MRLFTHKGSENISKISILLVRQVQKLLQSSQNAYEMHSAQDRTDLVDVSLLHNTILVQSLNIHVVIGSINRFCIPTSIFG